ncbi:hypothetical protein CCH79_00018925 [Gambusia affinis]|uniref:Uncharacterized protein n=1 Tax=Gambusia affinis TaxID=33528 RepID=A0A315VK30_GAMAF|nr:hypothetical protein CCH79_00018925 [Gambusia affinis]
MFHVSPPSGRLNDASNFINGSPASSVWEEITNKSYLSRNVEKESDFRIDLSIRACSLSM